MMGRGTFALVERSLRVETRLARTHLLRLIFALLILALLAHVQMDIDSYSTPGSDVFQRICWLNFFLLNLAGMSFFSTVITEEKEEMTLGLLRMAGISGAGILLGKVTPRLIGAALLLSVQMPFTLLSVTLGGVTQEQIAAAFSGMLAFAVMIAGLGSLLSTVCSRSNVASSLMTGILTVLCVAGPLLENISTDLRRNGRAPSAAAVISRLGECLQSLSLWAALSDINKPDFSKGILSTQFISNSVMGVAFFFAAWLLFDVCTRNEKPAAPPRGMMAMFSKRLASVGAQARVWNNALAWKDFNFMTGGMTALFIKLAAYAVLMGGTSLAVARQVQTDVRDTIGATLMMTSLTALCVEVPMYLSRLFREELRWQTWPGLVLLPQSIGWITRNKILGTLPAFFPALLLFVIGASLGPRFLSDLSREAFLTGRGWSVSLQYLLMLHIVVFLSLTVKWGALPMGVAIVATANLIWFAGAARQSSLVLYGVPVTAGIAGLFILPMFISRKLQELAQH